MTLKKDVWDLDVAIKMQLLRGVDLGRRVVAAMVAALVDADVTWIEAHKESKTVTATYIKNCAAVVVQAKMLDDGGVEIINASLDSICARAL
jgi:hypothetical protein